MPRRYSQHKPVTVLTPLPASKQSGELRPWKDGQRLHTLAQASQIISQEFAGNYSIYQLRQRIKNGLLGEAGYVWFFDGLGFWLSSHVKPAFGLNLD